MDPTKQHDKGNPPQSLKLIEQFLHESENPNYLKITPSLHPKLFNHILEKGNSISSEYDFSHTCKTIIRGSILHNFQYKNFIVYVDTGASINLIAKPHLKHLKYTTLLPQKLRITGINKTRALKKHERVSITLCENIKFEQIASFYVVEKIGTQFPTKSKDLKLVKELYSFSDNEMENFYTYYQPKDIQLLIGTPLSCLFFKEVLPVQIGKYQPPSSPNLRIYKFPLMKEKLTLGGKIGIYINLTPSFLIVHRSHFKDLKISKCQKEITNQVDNHDIFFTKAEHLSLEDFLKIEENKNSPKILCPFHKSANCTECTRLNNQELLILELLLT